MANVIPFLILAVVLLALVGVFWLMSRHGQKKRAGYTAAETLRGTHVVVIASSVTIGKVVELMLSSARIPFTFLALSRGVTPSLPAEARVAIVNASDARSEGLLLPAISSQRP